ncbi:MAG: hypothetical protein ACE5I2_15585 [Anaerolineae bacterium]
MDYSNWVDWLLKVGTPLVLGGILGAVVNRAWKVILALAVVSLGLSIINLLTPTQLTVTLPPLGVSAFIIGLIVALKRF